MEQTPETAAAATTEGGDRGRTAPGSVRRRGMARIRTVVVGGAVLLALGIVTSLTTAAPVYTDWSAPLNLGPIVNSASADGTPALSPDGLSLYFDSDRPGGLGGRDIWVSQRPTAGGPWGAPVNLGPTINTASSDYGPSFSPDGHWLFLNSNVPEGLGGLDVYQSYARTSTTISAGRRRRVSARTSTRRGTTAPPPTSRTQATLSCSSTALAVSAPTCS